MKKRVKLNDPKSQLLAYGDEIISYAIEDLNLNVKTDLSNATIEEIQNILAYIKSEPN